MIPDGTIRIDATHAIITPTEISKPNSCTIFIEVVISAINPIAVLIPYQNIEDLLTIFTRIRAIADKIKVERIV